MRQAYSRLTPLLRQKPKKQLNNQYLASKYLGFDINFAPFAAPGSLSPWLAGGRKTEQATSPVRFVAQTA